ncbi:hypothetical protein K6U47_10705 [Vibrio furnissii]|nr:hypothetical protein [Vibrio furnissii]
MKAVCGRLVYTAFAP